MRSILASVAIALACAPAVAEVPPGVRFGNAAADTTHINAILADAVSRNIASPQERTAYIAAQFIGIPYQGHTLEAPVEVLTVRLDSLDCTTFVETAMALSATAGEKRTSWRDFIYNLERLRYRGGKLDGYPSRLHYISDWALDNAHRGNLTEVTDRIPRCSYVVRSIDFMTAHRDKYAALKDSANYAGIKAVEMGYRNHRFPYIKSADLRQREVRDALRNGDVVGLVCKLKDLDVYHMGIIVKGDDGVPHLLHASSGNHKVELSASSLDEYMKRNPALMGIRVFRLND